MSKKTNKFITPKKNLNTYFLIVSILLVGICGFVLFHTVGFLIRNANDILSVNTGKLEKTKEFNMKVFEELKSKNPLNK
ncbi:MAG TPA: hypothetical protein PLH82_00985 [Candidatus Paceibacterota bacterium]|jgi:cell shape-determining protein MreC|nr:hypothetical protein [Candidatus Paceibacterota bacterium]HRV32070.1 hypothetical protein [Candidatus Paceibacterota bacterium]